MGKVLGVIGTILVAFAIFCYLFFGKGFGLGNGKGDGDGNGNAVNNEQDMSDNEESEPQNEISGGTGADNEITVVIEVKQSQYLIDGKEMTLSDIESLIQGYDLESTSFVIEDNYAAAKAWDEIKELFLSYEVSVVEQ